MSLDLTDRELLQRAVARYLASEMQPITQQFTVICDETNNPPESIALGYLKFDVFFHSRLIPNSINLADLNCNC